MWGMRRSYNQKAKGIHQIFSEMPFLVRYSTLDYSNVNRSQTFLTLLNVKRYTVTFIKGFEARCIDTGMVNKYIITLFLLDKSKPFCVIKPLYNSLSHCDNLLIVVEKLEIQ